MTLARLDVHNVRNIESAIIEPSSRLNFIVGPNGSGKTSLLEAIHILGRARSFRATQAGQVIRFQHDDLLVTGQVRDESGVAPIHIGIRLDRSKREIVLSGRKLHTSSELIRTFPVLLILPTSSALLEGAPKYRRQFLDWGAFHLDKEFLDNWRGYARALSQRNALLRACDFRGLEVWNHELSRYAKIIASARTAYRQRLAPYFREATKHFLCSTDFDLQTSAGWDTEKPLEQVLREEIQRDRRDGYTHFGPHKGDFSLLADGRPARNYLSRGQMKLLVYALLLAQAHLLEESLGDRGCVLIDDLASELDIDNRERLLQFLLLRHMQFFITTTDPRVVQHEGLEGAARFNVEHGRVTQQV